MPLVSIILPTYNRSDTLMRAIASVQNQTFQDWELIVVDDGSTDNTVSLLTGLDPRLTVICQPNQGTAGARNTGLTRAVGQYVSFLDSDDEWLPHHLELSVAFLQAFPEEDFVTAELWEDLGKGRIIKHYQIETSDWYPKMAERVGSCMLDLPAGEQDNYLRVYESRQPIGEWGQSIVARTPYQNVFHYRGEIFEQLRWGFLMCLQPTMITKRAIDAIGGFDPGYRIASDFGFAAALCRRFHANFLSIPACIKHELTPEGNPLAEDHVATGETAYLMGQDALLYLEKLFCNNRRNDQELAALRGWRQFALAQIAIANGNRSEALQYLEESSRNFPALWRSRVLGLVVGLVPNGTWLKRWYGILFKASYVWGQLVRKELSVTNVLHKIGQRLRPVPRPSTGI